jgi:hypothetical protein
MAKKRTRPDDQEPTTRRPKGDEGADVTDEQVGQAGIDEKGVDLHTSEQEVREKVPLTERSSEPRREEPG